MALVKCKECQTEMSKEATACPKCGAPPKKKKGIGTYIGWFFAVCVLFAIIGAFSDKDKKAESSGAEASPVPKQTGTQEAKAPVTPPPPPQNVFQLGERFTLGEFAYIVTGMSGTSKIGKNKYLRKEASEGALFIIVTYTIENMSNKTATVLADDFKIEDYKGRQFSPSSEVNTTLAMTGKNKDMFLSQIQPGLKREMMTGFEVPDDLVEGGFALVIPEKGFLGSKKAKIVYPGKAAKAEEG